MVLNTRGIYIHIESGLIRDIDDVTSNGIG
jgi:hypothetical protein